MYSVAVALCFALIEPYHIADLIAPSYHYAATCLALDSPASLRHPEVITQSFEAFDGGHRFRGSADGDPTLPLPARCVPHTLWGCRKSPCPSRHTCNLRRGTCSPKLLGKVPSSSHCSSSAQGVVDGA